MALTLTALFDKQNSAPFKNMVTAACWRHARTLLAKSTPTTAELKLASKLLSGKAIENFVVAVAVLIDDGIANDAAIEAAVVMAATKLVVLEA